MEVVIRIGVGLEKVFRSGWLRESKGDTPRCELRCGLAGGRKEKLHP